MLLVDRGITASTAQAALATVVPLLAAFVAEPIMVRRPLRWWGTAAGVAVASWPLPWLLAGWIGLPVFLDQGVVWALVLSGTGIVALRAGRASRLLAVAVLGFSWLALPITAGLVDGGPTGYAASQLTAGIALAVVTVACTVRGIQQLRRLPVDVVG